MKTGKTTLARLLVQRFRAHKTYIIDPLGEYGDLASESVLIEPAYQRAGAFAGEAWAQATPGRKTLIVFDEMEFYAKRPIDEEWLSKLYLVGRHWGISIVAVSKRFLGRGRWEGLPSLPRSQVSEWNLFQISEPADLEFLGKKLPKESLERLPWLEPGQYIKIVF